MRRALLTSVAAVALAAPAYAESVLPQGGTVASGSVDIAPVAGSTLTLTQGTNSAIVNWDSFSIGQGAHVNIQQPSANATMLNRVTGDTTSEIHGRLTANGNIHLVNPNGIFIGQNGSVDANGFVASTLDIDDGDFNSGQLRFRGTGSSATVSNAGRVTIGRGGYAALLGGKVRNSGIVTVPYGRIGFGAGERVTLDLSGDQFLEVAIPSSGDDGEFLIENSGTASAEGGLIEMRAATARNAVRNAINLSGVAEATSVSVRGGAIVLGGGSGGRVQVSGRVSTRTAPRIVVTESLRPVARGGSVEITGHSVALTGAEIDASGDAGGGLVQIGGDFAGQGSLLRSDLVRADTETLVIADAIDTGDGGRIVLWSDLDTDVASTLSARGGENGGNGGFVEVSSLGKLSFSGLTDTRAPQGDWGTLLLDPEDIIINAALATTLEATLATTNASLDTTNPGLSDPGDIIVNATVDWTAATTLTLNATNNITINPGGGFANSAAGTLAMTAGTEVFIDGDASIDINTLFVTAPTLRNSGIVFETTGGGAVNVTNFDMASGFSGEWFQVSPTLSDFNVVDFSVTPGNFFTRALSGDGSTGTPYRITDVFGLQGINSFRSDNYELANDIDASDTTGWVDNARDGFRPIGNFAGTFDGNGFTISNLFSSPDNGEGFDSAGMFGSIGLNGIVSDVVLTGVDVVGGVAGGLVGDNFGTVRNVIVSGTVSAGDFAVGGLVGSNSGLIEDSISNVDVTVSGFFSDIAVGGFVGSNVDGTINRSHATGDVNVTNTFALGVSAGGFAGEEISGTTISDSYATGNVIVSSTTGSPATVNIGGFIGDLTSSGTVNRSYSTGSLTTSGNAVFNAGGFAGTSAGFANGVFWDTVSSGQATSAAGTGLTTAQFQDTETFIALGTAVGWNFNTTWAPGDTGFYPVNYSTSTVILADPDDATIQYGLTTGASLTGTISGGPDSYVFDDGDDALDTSTVFDDFTLSAETVGVQTATLNTTSLTSTDGFVYRVVDRTANVTITAAPLTITADDVTKTYGDQLVFDGTEFTAGTLFFSDTVDSVTLTSLGATETAGVSGSPYAITPSAAVGTGLSNYTITFVDGALTVDPAPLTITIDDQTKVYGELFSFDDTEFTTAGLLLSDTVDFVALFSSGSSAEATVAGGPYAISDGEGLSGTGLENYDITIEEGLMTVTPAPLTITAADAAKTYGDALTFDGSEFTVAGLLFSDSVDSVTLTSDGSAADAGVAGSPYAITASAPVGIGVDNYAPTFVDGALTVNPAELSVTANDLTKTYGDELVFDGTEFTVAGLLFADSITSVTLSSDGSAANAPVVSGGYGISASDAVGTGTENYNISFSDGTLTVDPATLTIIPDDQTKTYGDTLVFDGTEFATLGLLFADVVDSVTLTSDGALAAATVADGPYDILASAAIGVGLENYDITFAPGTLTVDPAPLTITPDDASKPYGSVFTFDPTAFSVVGLLFSDAVNTVTLASEGADADAGVAGSPYAITASNPVGVGVENYAVTFAEGALTVTPATLTITANDQTKTYGDLFTFAGTEFTTSGLLFTDEVTSVTLTSDGSAVTASVADGPYAITASDAVGMGVENYDITFVDGSMSLDPAELAIRPNDQIKIVGTELVFEGTEFTSEGLLNSDVIASLTLTSDGAPAEAPIEGSPFDILGSDPVGIGLNNYDIILTPGVLTVTAAVEEEIPIPPPFIDFPLPNPEDTLGGVLGDSGQALDELIDVVASGQLPTGLSGALPAAEEVLTEVEAISESLTLKANSCEQQSGSVGRYLACLSDSLDAFASELDEIATDLPPGMQNVARIVQDARVKVDSARVRAQSRLATASSAAEREAIRRDAVNESRAALAEAATEIRKAISLVRAEDPELANVQRATVTRVADAVDQVGISLSRAVDL